MAIVDEIVQGTVAYTAPNASEMLNVFWWKIQTAGATDQEVLDTIDTWVSTQWGPDWDGLAATDFDLINLEVKVINPDGTVNRTLGNAVQTIAGTISNDMCAPAVSCYIQADTIMAGVKGRKYVPGMSEIFLTDGLIESAVLTIMLLLLDEYVLPITLPGGGSLTPGVLRRAVSLFEFFISAGGVVDVPAYQRRRKPNVGS